MDTSQQNHLAELTHRAQMRLHLWTLSKGRPPNSARPYNRLTYLRLIRDADFRGVPVNQVLAPTGVKASYRIERAIVRRYDCAELVNCLTELQSSAAVELEQPKLDAIVKRMEASLRRLDECDAPMPELQKSQKRRISRAALRAPQDWQTRMIDASSGPLKVALCVLALTGCRPGEVEHGFGFRLGTASGGARLELRIRGNKVDELRGQPSRTLVFAAHDTRPEIDFLVSAFTQLSSDSLAGEYPPAVVARKISALSKKLWPGLERRPTARSFRYVVRCSLHKRGFTPLEIAAYLGQRSTESQLTYGRPWEPRIERQRVREREREYDYEPVRDLQIEPHEYCGPRPAFLPGHGQQDERLREREVDIDDEWDADDDVED